MSSTYLVKPTKSAISPVEMQVISEEIKRGFSPKYFISSFLNTKSIAFTAQELLSISQEIAREYAISKSFGTNDLVLIPINPQQLHVYWQIPNKTLLKTNLNETTENLTLRLFKHNDYKNHYINENQTYRTDYYDFAININQNNFNLNLSLLNDIDDYKNQLGNNSHKNNSIDLFKPKLSNIYTAAIGCLNSEQNFTTFAVASPQIMPHIEKNALEKDLNGFSVFVSNLTNTSSPNGNYPNK